MNLWTSNIISRLSDGLRAEQFFFIELERRSPCSRWGVEFTPFQSEKHRHIEDHPLGRNVERKFMHLSKGYGGDNEDGVNKNIHACLNSSMDSYKTHSERLL